jgi:hypothetical protein
MVALVFALAGVMRNAATAALSDLDIPQAESLGYTVKPEESIPEHGRPDLILTRGKRSFVCEINATTRPETEADHMH